MEFKRENPFKLKYTIISLLLVGLFFLLMIPNHKVGVTVFAIVAIVDMIITLVLTKQVNNQRHIVDYDKITVFSATGKKKVIYYKDIKEIRKMYSRGLIIGFVTRDNKKAWAQPGSIVGFVQEMNNYIRCSEILEKGVKSVTIQES